MHLNVVCAAERGADDIPRCFFIGARRVEAVEVIDRWPASDHCYYKVRGDDDATYILRHDVPSDRWELTLFHAGATPGGLGPLSGATASGV